MPPPRQTPAPEDASVALAPRAAALRLFEAALARRGGLEEAAAARSFLDLDTRDRAFARALALTALRRLGGLDARLQPRLRAPPPGAVMNLLRLGAAQILHMEVPGFAAVATCVDLAKAASATRPFQGLVNAVLRGLAAEPATRLDPEVYAPPWLFARWRSAYGLDRARRLAAAIPLEPPTDLTPARPETAQALAVLLDAQILPGGSLRTLRRGDVAGWPQFEEGGYWVQDAAAALPARLLRPCAGETILDLCAAPGGKTLQLAASGAQVIAVDRSAARLRRLEENLARTRLSAEIRVSDVLALTALQDADAVLLDAPCSATGTFRRHPDVLWACRPSDIAALALAQARLLDAAAAQVRPGGRLVYCVCSLEPEEGEAQVDGFLARRPDFSLEPVGHGEAGTPAGATTLQGWVRLLPNAEDAPDAADGFFIARFRRRS